MMKFCSMESVLYLIGMILCVLCIIGISFVLYLMIRHFLRDIRNEKRSCSCIDQIDDDDGGDPCLFI